MQSKKTTKDLWGVIQGPNESLRAYIKRFNKAISEISRLDDGTAREALKKGLRHKSSFKNEICARYPSTIQDAMNRAKEFIEALRAEVAKLLRKGHLREFLTEKRKETYGLSNESKE
ncbi:hypothetical protein TIFTF001_020171 [Ficus carica]|uniref:Retrotransposon gag domain-containing protein n=1 Tax=Ficus carica TaxID=3494 RepID=A0AA88ATR4_FICCA|nr:hypothetical protein TIFTF001_020171 [Ficus carica]